MGLTLTVRVNESVKIGDRVLTLIKVHPFKEGDRSPVEFSLCSPTVREHPIFAAVGQPFLIGVDITAKIKPRNSGQYHITIEAPKTTTITRLGKTRHAE